MNGEGNNEEEIMGKEIGGLNMGPTEILLPLEKEFCQKKDASHAYQVR